MRKDFLPSEAVAIGRALEPVEQEAAKEWQEAGANQYSEASGKFPEGPKGQARDKVSAYTGMSGRTYDKASAVVKAAEAEPEKYDKLVADMDRTGRVDGPYKRLVVARKAEAIEKEPGDALN